MSDFNLVMPKLGESVQEATITKWLVKPGDMVQEDDALLEIATDKVDSEIPSPVAGKVLKVLFAENALVPVGEVIAIINTEGEGKVDEAASAGAAAGKEKKEAAAEEKKEVKQGKEKGGEPDAGEVPEEEKGVAPRPMAGKEEKLPEGQGKSEEVKGNGAGAEESGSGEGGQESGRFYSPLVKSIAKKENITGKELESIPGKGTNGRIRKQDILSYLEIREKQPPPKPEPAKKQEKAKITIQPGDEIVEMDRVRKMIAEHMVMSKQTSPHVTNFVEADVTALALWRDKVKDEFLGREKIKLTFMPAFIEATAKALKEYPGVNASVDGDRIILRKNINIGIAVALKSGNLIVPVIKNADQKSMLGLAVDLNRLAEASRSNALSPDDIQGGTFTISNFGTFRNLTGTPIINQPQVAILATGNIEKRPAVIETSTGDVIAIRHKMILSLSYDHRVVDGALGGMFLRRIADLLENFDMNRNI